MNKPYITTGLLGSGYAAILLGWNPDGFYEPWNTSPSRYATREEAEADARDWAMGEGIEFRPETNS